MLPALEGTLAHLGIDLRAQENVELDLDERPTKDPRAFCSPIEVPGRVVLVLQPQGGPNDWRALFHEAGHTEHFAHTDASLSPEEKRLGDNSLTEGWAMLLEYLTTDPVWLERRLDFPRPYEFAAEAAVQLLWIVRRYSAKLLYELEFHTAEDLTALQPRYGERLADATKVSRPPPTTSATSTTASMRPSTSARGPSRHSCGPISGSALATPGSRAARPAHCSVSCGRRARSRRPTSCSER
jgi:hypothetical protein